jgi:hypothetical protein
VPVEEREYIRDQRLKTGTRGSFQLGPVDRSAAAKEKAREAAKLKKLAKTPLRKGQHLEEVAAIPVFEVCVNVNVP